MVRVLSVIHYVPVRLNFSHSTVIKQNLLKFKQISKILTYLKIKKIPVNDF
jgi:hypothetical protein